MHHELREAFDLLTPTLPDPVEVAINEASQAQWDKLLRAFGYRIISRGKYDHETGLEPSGMWLFERHGCEFRQDFGSKMEAYGEALQHLQENIPAEDVLAELEATSEAKRAFDSMLGNPVEAVSQLSIRGAK